MTSRRSHRRLCPSLPTGSRKAGRSSLEGEDDAAGLGRTSILSMHSTLPSDIRGSTLRLAVAAVIVGLAIPLLPLFGEGGRLKFIFSQGLPVRFLIVYLLRWWAAPWWRWSGSGS